MIAPQQCPACGSSLPVDAPRGLCVECLMRLAEDPSLTQSTDDACAWEKPSGTSRFGDYELLRQIGRGGMGVVYEARQISLNRIVALKMILGGDLASLSLSAVRRFKAEAEAAAMLAHPNIVAVHEFGEHDGLPFFSMERIAGTALDRNMSTLALPSVAGKAGEKNVDRTAAAEAQVRIAKLVATVARALHYAHEHGVIHCDVKPANVLIDERGEPHITDFGIAHFLDEDGKLTKSGVIGSPRYMAPEQASGKRGEITAATDIYGLGVILYELLTGHTPFRAVTPSETLQQVMEREPPAPHVAHPLVDRDLSIICLKCLEKSASHRYASAAELADDLERWIRREPILARRATPPKRLLRWCQRKPAIATLAASVALLLMIVAMGFALFLRREYVNTKEREATMQEREATMRYVLDESMAELDELWESLERSEPVKISSERLSILMNDPLRHSASDPDELMRLSFGVYTFDAPKEMFEKFGPLIWNLEGSIAKEMPVPVRVDFLLYPSYDAGLGALVAREVDFMRIGPSSYLSAKDKDSGISLLAAQEPAIEGAIITRIDSGIDDLSQLKGHSIAFGDRTSTIGNDLFKAALFEEGIVAANLGSDSKHFPSHRSVREAVADEKGTYKAGAINKIFVEPPLKLVREFKTGIGMPFVARSGLEPAVEAAIKAALLGKHDPSVLESIEEDVTGFREAKDEEYDRLREQIKQAHQFGELEEQPEVVSGR